MDIELKVRWKEFSDPKETNMLIQNYNFGLVIYIESFLKIFEQSSFENMSVSIKCGKRCLTMCFNRFYSYNYSLKKNYSIEGIDYKRSTIKKGIQEFSKKFLNFCIEDEKKCLTKNKLNYEKI